MLTVIVPCYNEEQSIAQTVGSIVRVTPELDLKVELLLVDDGSSDRTAEEMEKLCEKFPFCRMKRNEKNLGLGRTVLSCYSQIPRQSWVTVIPGDNEFIFGSVKNLLAIRHDFDLILGYLQNTIIRNILRRMASDTFSAIVRFIYGYPYKYLNGMKLYRIAVFESIEVVSTGHAFNAELLAKAILRNPGLRVGEAPFLARGRSLGQTKAFRLSSIIRAVRDILVGYRSVSRYRDKIIQSSAEDMG